MKHRKAPPADAGGTSPYKIEKNVPIPKSTHQYQNSKLQMLHGALAKMEVGDSFELRPEEMKRLRYFRSAASTWGRFNNVRLSVRKMNDGKYRCYRVL